MLKKTINFFLSLRDLSNRLSKQTQVNSHLLAKLLICKIKELDGVYSLKDVEFKIYSQWGEDGIIQYLLSKIPIQNEVFIEIGVENYTQANTRFLLINNNWKGLVIDCSAKNIDYIKKDDIYWQHDLAALCHFITKENINDIIDSTGIKGDIGLLSIDIDGNDYWVWEAIHTVNPRIVICEYNSVFGNEQAIVVPYDTNFCRTVAHYSGLYFGCSLPALCKLAETKGYKFIGSNSSGVNAFFVREDLYQPFETNDRIQGYIETKIRQSRDKQGQLTFVSAKDSLQIIADLQAMDLNLGVIRPIKEIMEI